MICGSSQATVTRRGTIYRLKGGAIFIDATSKPGSLPAFPREWPNVVCSDSETIELVDRRWNEYNVGELHKSPSLKVLPFSSRDRLPWTEKVPGGE